MWLTKMARAKRWAGGKGRWNESKWKWVVVPISSMKMLPVKSNKYGHVLTFLYLPFTDSYHFTIAVTDNNSCLGGFFLFTYWKMFEKLLKMQHLVLTLGKQMIITAANHLNKILQLLCSKLSNMSFSWLWASKWGCGDRECCQVGQTNIQRRSAGIFLTLRFRQQGWERQGRAKDNVVPAVCTAQIQCHMVRPLPTKQDLHCRTEKWRKILSTLKVGKRNHPICKCNV